MPLQTENSQVIDQNTISSGSETGDNISHLLILQLGNLCPRDEGPQQKAAWTLPKPGQEFCCFPDSGLAPWTTVALSFSHYNLSL